MDLDPPVPEVPARVLVPGANIPKYVGRDTASEVSDPGRPNVGRVGLAATLGEFSSDLVMKRVYWVLSEQKNIDQVPVKV